MHRLFDDMFQLVHDADVFDTPLHHGHIRVSCTVLNVLLDAGADANAKVRVCA